MENSIIAIFCYNKKKYIIYLKNKKVEFGWIKEKTINNNLEKNEIQTMQKVYDQIRVEQKTSVDCGKYKIDGQNFRIFLDQRNGMYSFALEYKNQYYVPPKKYLKILNYYYNSQSSIFYEEISVETKAKEDKKLPSFFKRMIAIAGITSMVFVRTGVALNMLPKQAKFEIKYEIQKDTKKDLTKLKKDYNYEDVIKAIESNPNLPQEDKKFFIEVLEEEFEENKEYMDIQNVLSRLRTCQVKYNKKYIYNERTGKYEETNRRKSPNQNAQYNRIINQISLEELAEMTNLEELNEEYEKKKFDFDTTDKSIYFHELNHLQTNFTWDSDIEWLVGKVDNIADSIDQEFFSNFSDSLQGVNANSISETTNELFSREYYQKYLDKYPNAGNKYGYSDYMPYQYALAEILSEEALRTYKFNDNTGILITDLLEIDPNIDEAYKLMTSINSIRLFEKRGKEEEIKENSERIREGLAYFYEKKYNRNMFDDRIMLLYLYDTPIITQEEKQKIENFLRREDTNSIIKNIKVIPKGYVSESYKKKHPHMTVEYTKYGVKMKKAITDKNRYDEKEKVEEEAER